MKVKSFATILKVCTLAALFVVASNVSAYALPIVSFNTTGDFQGAATTSVTFGAGGNTTTLSFAGVNTALNTPTNTSFGEITVTTAGTGYSGPTVNPFSFTLTINQTLPLPNGSNQFVGNLTGTLSRADSGDFFLQFSNTSLTIGDVNYTLQQPPGGYALVPPSVNGGVTSIQGAITATSPVPEPASMMLLGTGLLAAFRARRKVGLK